MFQTVSTSQTCDQLIQLISPSINAIGYQVIYLEIQPHRQKVLRVYIDHLDESSKQGIGIEDCVAVSRLLGEQLDQLPDIESILPGAYELEISSPGVDRPLRTERDFQKFAGSDVRIHVYRPLTADEMENLTYYDKHPRQKNFMGSLLGIQNGKAVILIHTNSSGSHVGKASKAKKDALLTTNSVEGLKVAIPLPLISKANLEPQFDFEGVMKESHEL
jgi:ribosome maturation factor RimP